MKAKRFIYWFGGILGVILLGAIANGVWSGILSPALSWLVDIIIRALSSISVTFKNSIYTEAAEGFHENISLNLYVLVSSVMIGLLLCILYFDYERRFKRSKEKALSFVDSKKEFVIVNIVIISVFIAWMFFIASHSYINRVTTQSLNSIDIIAPFIEQNEYLLLKSDFLRIKKSEDYEQLYRKMKELSEKYEVELPMPKPL